MSTTPGAGHLDDLNRAIIAQLREDGRRSYASIAKTVGLSEAAVRQRVQRLLDSDVLRIVAIPNSAALGLSRQASVQVSVSGPSRQVAETITRMPEVLSVVVAAGPIDLLVHVACENDEQLLDFTETVRALPGVTGTSTLVHLLDLPGPMPGR